METTKKMKWGNPLIEVQQFTPQEFVAACDNSGATQTYYFMCDGGLSSARYNVILDSNHNQTLDGSWNSSWGGYTWSGGDELLTKGLSYYHPCNEQHTVTVPYGSSVEDIFPHGWIQQKDSHGNSWTAVRIWRGDNNDNIHCTTNLRSEDFIPHNPS